MTMVQASSTINHIRTIITILKCASAKESCTMLELGRTDVTTRNIVKELARIGALSASEPNKYRLVVFSITEKGKKILELHSELESLLK